MMPLEIAKQIVELTHYYEPDQDRIDDLVSRLFAMTGREVGKRLLMEATAPTIH